MIYGPIICNEYSLNISDGSTSRNRIEISEVFKESKTKHDHLPTIPMPKTIIDLHSSLLFHAISVALQSNCDVQSNWRVYLRRGI